MIYLVLSLLISYLIGAIPTGYIYGKVFKGIDIRAYGSGNIGATNIFRTVGKAAGIGIFFLDALKGVIAVTLVPSVMGKIFPECPVAGYSYVVILMGLAAISGHIWTCFLKFKGGKGVATTAGVIIGLAPTVFVTCFIVWVIVFSVWKYVSLASISAAAVLPVVAIIFGKGLDFIIFCALLSMLGVFSHRSNIKRLLKGTETPMVKV